MKKAQKVAYFNAGRLLHILQDAYSFAHIIRSKRGHVISFQDYTKQDGTKHCIKESTTGRVMCHGPKAIKKIKKFAKDFSHALFKKCRRQTVGWIKVYGAKPALTHSKAVMQMFESGKSAKDVETYLKKNVFYFLKGFGKRKSGGSHASIASSGSKKTIQVKEKKCCVHVTIKEKKKEDKIKVCYKGCK